MYKSCSCDKSAATNTTTKDQNKVEWGRVPKDEKYQRCELNFRT